MSRAPRLARRLRKPRAAAPAGDAPGSAGGDRADRPRTRPKRRSVADSQAPPARRSAADPLAQLERELRPAPPARRSAADSLAQLERELQPAPRPRRSAADSLAQVERQLRAETVPADAGAVDFVMPARPIALELVGGRGHYERVIAAVTAAHTSVWIATANVKGLMVEDARARPGRRRSLRRASFVSILALLAELAERGVELRLLHADLPSGPFREELAHHPRLVAGGLALRRCPRVHMKAVIVDGELLYLGSANWTGAGLGAKGSGRRNFELGFVTDDAPLLDQIQALYDRVWRGGECAGCKLRDVCPGPLADLDAGPPPVTSTIRRRARPRLL